MFSEAADDLRRDYLYLPEKVTLARGRFLRERSPVIGGPAFVTLLPSTPGGGEV